MFEVRMQEKNIKTKKQHVHQPKIKKLNKTRYRINLTIKSDYNVKNVIWVLTWVGLAYIFLIAFDWSFKRFVFLKIQRNAIFT